MSIELKQKNNFSLTSNNKIFIGFATILSLLILMAQYKLAGMLLALFIFIGLILSILQKKNILYTMTWVLGFAPFVALLRPFVLSYSGFTAILILIFGIYFLFARKIILKIIFDRYMMYFLLLFSFYILFGLLQSASLISFMKYIEYMLGAVLIATLFLNKKILAEGLVNFLIGTILFWISIVPAMSDRFIVSSNYGFEITADPSAGGAFLIMSLIVLLFDSGRLVYMNNQKKIKGVSIFILFVFLILSTSRTNMAIILVLLIIYAFSQGKAFIKYSLLFIPIAIFSYPMLSSETQARIEIMYIKKLNSDERSLNQLTTGRADQWAISLYHIYDTSWENKIFGIGIGNRDFYRDALKKYGYKLKLESVGRAYVLHSLYLIILVEMGIIAFIYFITLLLYKLFQNYKLFRAGFIIPFYFTFAYIITIFANQGIGILGAIFIAFIMHSKQLYYLKEDENEISYYN